MAKTIELEKCFDLMIGDGVSRIIISSPASKNEKYKKIIVEPKAGLWQIASYTEKQVFHENVAESDLAGRLFEITENHFRQVNGFSVGGEHIALISKKGVCAYKKKNANPGSEAKAEQDTSHNRKKKYILQEGTIIPPLVDMGVFTKDGKVVASMCDKFRQINRFLEILDDEIGKEDLKHLNVIDFGCGKSYLTFVIYYYLTFVRKIEADIIGLDLKADVIEKCNAATEKYGYDRLKFEVGDVNGFTAPFDVDMVVTLHACDTATDYALFNAVNWNTSMIFSVPCCQHELNGQAKAKELSILTRYGIIKERFCALATDAIRANLLEIHGYRTQLLEFIDMEGTPKNLLIRAVKRKETSESRKAELKREVEDLNAEFGFKPKLQTLLEKN